MDIQDVFVGAFADELLSMVYAHCMDYQSVNQMARWYERTDLNMMLSLEGLTEARLLEAMDHLESLDPVELQKNIFANVRQRYELARTGIVYDVTNTYLYGLNSKPILPTTQDSRRKLGLCRSV